MNIRWTVRTFTALVIGGGLVFPLSTLDPAHAGSDRPGNSNTNRGPQGRSKTDKRFLVSRGAYRGAQVTQPTPGGEESASAPEIPLRVQVYIDLHGKSLEGKALRHIYYSLPAGEDVNADDLTRAKGPLPGLESRAVNHKLSALERARFIAISAKGKQREAGNYTRYTRVSRASGNMSDFERVQERLRDPSANMEDTLLRDIYSNNRKKFNVDDIIAAGVYPKSKRDSVNSALRRLSSHSLIAKVPAPDEGGTTLTRYSALGNPRRW